MKPIAIVLLVLNVFLAQAQDTFVIKNVTLFDGTEVIKKTSILVEDGMIAKVSKRIKGDYTIIDGSGKFLMPGMTNAHVHVFSPVGLVQAAKAGVLNVLDMHGMEPAQNMMIGMRDSTNHARLFRAGYAATAPGGHGTQYGFPIPTLDKPEDAKQWVSDRAAAGVDYIKIIVEPWRTTLNPETVAAIIEEGHKADKVVVAHVSKADDAYKSIQSGIDGLVHIYDDQQMTAAQLKELTANNDFFIIPTILTITSVQPLFYGKNEEETAIIEANILEEVKRYYDAGVPILAGTDPPNANINMGTDLYKELAFFAKAGIPTIDILKSATSLPADKFKLEKLGYIKEGYIADMLLLDKSPLTSIGNISSISSIWKAGKMVE